jgi:putative aldouronate transport system permease protein
MGKRQRAIFRGGGLSMKRKGIPIANIVIGCILGIWAIIIIVPFYNVIIVSISPLKEYTRNPFLLFPSKPTIDSYKALFETARVFIGYKTTFLILVIGLPLNLVLIMTTAYALSRNDFPFKKLFLYLIIFTMFFSGGIIPLYLTVKGLGLTNSIWSVILVGGMNTFYFILARNFLQTIPASLVESAKLDGANELTILVRIMLPLSMPIIATVALFCTVDRWNEWIHSMLFLRSNSMVTLQNVLRSIVNDANMDELKGSSGSSALSASRSVKGMKMAAIVVTMTPIMLVYPFLQKYFVKGILVGAIKA